MILDGNKILINCELDINSEIIDVLGEKFYSLCLENPANTLNFSRLLSLSLTEFNKANGIDSEISNKLLEMQDTLGEGPCNWYLKNSNELNNVLNVLSSYVENYNNYKKINSKLNRVLGSIDQNNLKARINPLISVYEMKEEVIKLVEIFGIYNINYVSDLLRLKTLKLNEKETIQLISLVEWFVEDKMSKLINELYSLFKHKRDLEIIRKRTQGATLEETSNDYGLTHEGVRLIEKKFSGRFKGYLTTAMPHFILYAFGKYQAYITMEELKDLLGDIADIFTYYLKLSNCATAHWSEELNGFLIGEASWYKRLKEYQKELPEIIDGDSVDDLINYIIDHLALPLCAGDTKKLILRDYSFSGKVFLRNKMSLTRMYYTVLEKYYPDGIRLYDDSESIRFRSYVRELFGDVNLPKNNRAIEVRLSDLTILCDKGKRILPSGIKIPLELLRKIHDAIVEFDKNEIMFRVLFEKFKDELLENSNITNKYFLQGVLRENFSHEFYFTRYAIRKTHFSPSQAK